ncbi:MAG: MotA/TolQ/ExbB proton channel family protein [Candidatus Delongbacteria bacterium]|nr:MotA/TolQ/ExbB proton channel family protein [Candidatus Delongbacteria bacterium]MBP7460510.1 MotA/TolQ/ExbB proton channel family protein [Candidatus Delongbacteria bacterium]
MDFMIRLFVDGGTTMYFILFFNLVALFIILERIYYLFFRANMDANQFMGEIQRLYKEKKINDAIGLAYKRNKPFSRLIGAALQNHENTDRGIQDAMDEVFLTESPRIKRYTSFLTVLGQITTLLGLLGTIVGLIEAFDALAGVNPALRTEQLAMGISKAMATTAYGLMVAVFCIFGYAILNVKTDQLIDDIDENSVKIINFINRYR